MSLREVVKTIEKFASDNSPTILTAIGVAGSVTTAYFTGKATYKAALILNEPVLSPGGHKAELRERDLSGREKFELLYKLYIPAVTTGGLTIGAIVLANRIGTRRAAAVAAAYTISEKAFTEYRDKVVELHGKNKEQKVQDEIARDLVRRNPPSEAQIFVTGDGDSLCLDAFSGRYFRSSHERLRKAENDINFQILNHDSATVSNYYSNIGLPPNDISDYVGWNTGKRLELHFSAILVEEDDKPVVPCMVVGFGTVPIHDPWQFQ